MTNPSNPAEWTREETNEAIRKLINEAAPIKQKLLAISETAHAQAWDWERFMTERAPLQKRLSEISEHAQRLFEHLQELDRREKAALFTNEQPEEPKGQF